MSRSVFALALCGVVARSAFGQAPAGDSARIAVDRVFAQWNRTDSPGCALGVARGGKMIFEKGYLQAARHDAHALSR